VLPIASDLPVAMINVRDTGAVGACILIDPAPHAGKTYEFTGALTTYAKFAEVFSQVLGRKIMSRTTPSGLCRKARWMPDWVGRSFCRHGCETLRQRRLYPSKTQTSSTTSSSVRRSPPDSSSRTTRVFLAANWAGFTALFGRQDMTVGKSAMMPNGS
jgi:hypothetical protein